jgi:hypothetical protein
MNAHDDMEQRLRTAFRSVAKLPHPATNRVRVTTDRQPGDIGRRRPPRLLIAVASGAALALVIALAVIFGPHSSAPSGTHDQSPAPASNTGPPRTTTTNPTPVPGLGRGTEQITYQPFIGAMLKPELHVSSQESGTCFTYGGGAQGRYIYRCGTMQPCVAGSLGTGAPLACPLGSPASNDVVLWTATSVDSTGFTPPTAKTPFAMQLSNGAFCVLVNAAWSGLGPFGCDGSPSGGGTPPGLPADCRQPVPAAAATTSRYWTARCQAQLTQTSPFLSTTVVKIWF